MAVYGCSFLDVQEEVEDEVQPEEGSRVSAEKDQIILQGDEQEIEAEESRNRNITSMEISLPSAAETSSCSD